MTIIFVGTSRIGDFYFDKNICLPLSATSRWLLCPSSNIWTAFQCALLFRRIPKPLQKPPKYNGDPRDLNIVLALLERFIDKKFFSIDAVSSLGILFFISLNIWMLNRFLVKLWVNPFNFRSQGRIHILMNLKQTRVTYFFDLLSRCGNGSGGQIKPNLTHWYGGRLSCPLNWNIEMETIRPAQPSPHALIMYRGVEFFFFQGSEAVRA